MISRFRYVVSHNRIITSVALGLLLFLFAKPTLLSIALGLPFLLLGEAIRIYSSGYIQKDSVLAREGPYSLTRNPLYLGNFFLGLGFVIMASRWYLIGIYLILFYFVYDSTIQEEERKLLEQFGRLYEEYAGRVPRFFPNGRAWGSWRGEFSWSLVKKHREVNTCYGIVLGIGFVLLKMIIVS